MPQLADIFEALTGERPGGGEQWISGATQDSRRAADGSLFVALGGERTNGHEYVAQAFEQGALIALVERQLGADFNCVDITGGETLSAENSQLPLCIRCENSLAALQELARFWRRKLDLRVVGITGSVGKTTSKEVIFDVLSRRLPTIKSEGNYNNEIGLPLTIIGLDPSHEYAVLEMGFYVPGEIAFLAEIAQPQIGVVSTVGLVHAERAGSQQAIFEGKSELVQALPADGLAILNRDDNLVTQMAERTQAEVLFYGMHKEAHLRATEVQSLGLEGLSFQMSYQGKSQAATVPMLGAHSVYTALRAAAVGFTAGMEWDEILAGLSLGSQDVRLIPSKARNGATLLNDTYNASPDSTLAALDLLADLEGRRIAVLGDMLELGPYEEQGHIDVGRRAAEIADLLLTVGDRARTIAAAAEEKGLSEEAIHQFADSEAALNFLRQNLRSSDAVLVKGSRAMQMEGIVPQLEVLP